MNKLSLLDYAKGILFSTITESVIHKAAEALQLTEEKLSLWEKAKDLFSWTIMGTQKSGIFH